MQRPLPSLNALRAFEATARLGSASQAAQELYVTHGAISRQIRLLEQEVGQALFTREGRGLRITPAGRQLQEAATAAFERLRQTALALRRTAQPHALVLGCPASLMARWMIPRLQRLERDLPGMALHLAAREGDFDPALSGLDAALMLARPPWPAAWRTMELGPERVGPVISPRHPDYSRLANASPVQVLEQPLLHTTSRPQAWPEWAARQGIDARRLHYGTGFEHLYYLLEAAVAGMGMAIAPEPLVREDLASGRLAAPWGFQATGGVWVLASRRGDDPAQVDRLSEWLRQELEQNA